MRGLLRERPVKEAGGRRFPPPDPLPPQNASGIRGEADLMREFEPLARGDDFVSSILVSRVPLTMRYRINFCRILRRNFLLIPLAVRRSGIA